MVKEDLLGCLCMYIMVSGQLPLRKIAPRLGVGFRVRVSFSVGVKFSSGAIILKPYVIPDIVFDFKSLKFLDRFKNDLRTHSLRLRLSRKVLMSWILLSDLHHFVWFTFFGKRHYTNYIYQNNPMKIQKNFCLFVEDFV